MKKTIVCFLYLVTQFVFSQSDTLFVGKDTVLFHDGSFRRIVQQDSLLQKRFFSKQIASHYFHKGYTTTYFERNDSVFLQAIYDSRKVVQHHVSSSLHQVPCFAFWLTEVQRANASKEMMRTAISEKPFLYVYKKEYEVAISNGILNKIQPYDNRNAKQSKHFLAFEKDFFWIKHFDSIAIQKLPKNHEFRYTITFSANEKGTIDSIFISSNTENTELEQELKRIIRLCEPWNVYYQKGKFIRVEKKIQLVVCNCD